MSSVSSSSSSNNNPGVVMRRKALWTSEENIIVNLCASVPIQAPKGMVRELFARFKDVDVYRLRAGLTIETHKNGTVRFMTCSDTPQEMAHVFIQSRHTPASPDVESLQQRINLEMSRPLRFGKYSSIPPPLEPDPIWNWNESVSLAPPPETSRMRYNWFCAALDNLFLHVKDKEDKVTFAFPHRLTQGELIWDAAYWHLYDQQLDKFNLRLLTQTACKVVEHRVFVYVDTVQSKGDKPAPTRASPFDMPPPKKKNEPTVNSSD